MSRARWALFALLVVIVGVFGGYAGAELAQRNDPHRVGALGGPAGSLGGSPLGQFQSRSGQRLDANSLVPGALDAMAWQTAQPTLAPPVMALAGAASNGVRSLVCVNCEQTAPLNGYLERPWTMPCDAGTTIAEELDSVQLYTGDVSTGSFKLQIYDSAGLNQVATATITPSGTATMATTGSVTVTPCLEYRARLVTNIAGVQSRFLAGNIRIRPLAPTNSFWSSFNRLEVDHSNLWGNQRRGRFNPRYSAQGSVNYVDLYTSAAQMRVELYDSISQHFTTPGTVSAELAVNGYPYGKLVPTPGVDVSYQTVALPSAVAQPMRVKVTSGMQAIGGFVSTQQLDPAGLYLDAVYVPGGAYIEALSPGPVKRAVVWGDSKSAGYLASLPGGTTFAEHLRLHGWDLQAIALGSDSYFNEVGVGNTPFGNVNAWATQLNSVSSDIFILAMGRNDFFFGYITPAQIVTAAANFLDAYHQAEPHAYVLNLTWSHEATESPVSGTSWNAERQNILALCTTRQPWCLNADLGGAITSAMCSSAPSVPGGAYCASDGVHPADPLEAREARIIEGTAIPLPPANGSRTAPQSYDFPYKPWVDSAPTAYWESDVGVAGTSTWGSVTSAGTSPPTVTVSGTPTFAGRLQWRIAQPSGGGTLGTAVFDASFDGGRSWPVRSQATNAAAVLAPFGITLGFASGTYAADNFYYATNAAGNWTDTVAGTVLTNTMTAVPLPVGFGHNGVQSVRMTGGSGALSNTFASISSPYSVMWCGSLDTNGGSNQSLVGRGGLTTGPLMYQSSAGNVLTWNNGSAVTSAGTVNMTSPHCIISVFNGASSSVSIDGVTTSGTAGTTALTAITIGQDSNLSFLATGYVDVFGVWPAALSSDQIYSLSARGCWKYGACGTTATTQALRGQLLAFGASTSLTTAVAQYLPAGSGSTTQSTDSTIGTIVAGQNRLVSQVQIQFTGSSSNVGGQTVTTTIYSNGSSIASVGGMAATAGVKQGSTTFGPTQIAAGAVITASITPSGILTAALTDVMVSVQ